MPIRPQPYRLKWPLTPSQVEGIDEMLQILFKTVYSLEVNGSTPGGIGPGGTPGLPGGGGTPGPVGLTGQVIPGLDGDDGQDGAPALPGPQGLQGERGFPGSDGEDGDPGLFGAPGLPGPQGREGNAGIPGDEGDEGPQGVPGPIGPQGLTGAAAGRQFYPDPLDASDLVGYFTALTVPSTNAETTLTSAMVGTGDNLLASFATDPGVPGVTSLPAGTEFRHIYVTTGAVNQVGRLKVELYRCEADGTVETLLRSGYSQIFASDTPIVIDWTFSDGNSFILTPTQRFVFKIYGARVSGPATCDLTVYFDGTDHTSVIQSTISVGVTGPTGATGQTGAQGIAGVPGHDGEDGQDGWPVPSPMGSVSSGTVDMAAIAARIAVRI